VSRRNVIKGVVMAFFVVVAVLLVSCQMVPSQPAGHSGSSHRSLPIIADSKDPNLLWGGLPVMDYKSEKVEVSALVNSFPEAKATLSKLSRYHLAPVSAEKIHLIGSWLNGEGEIGAIRCEYTKGDAPGLWMVFGKGFGGNTVSLLIPVDEEESKYQVWVQAESLGADFYKLPILIRGEYDNYKMYANVLAGGLGALFSGFFGSLMGYITSWLGSAEIAMCLQCWNDAGEFESAVSDLSTSIDLLDASIDEFDDCCDSWSRPDYWSHLSISTWNLALTSIYMVQPPASNPCSECRDEYYTWRRDWINTSGGLRQAERRWDRMMKTCGLCLGSSLFVDDSLTNWWYR